jgi:parallel beta-helix repeat protein
MKTRKTILKGTVSVSFFIVLVIFFFKSDNPAQTKQLDLNCPPPTVQKGIQCVLEEDVVLEETLELFSDTKLNCQDHTLTPATPGVESVCVCSDSFTSPCTCSSEHVASTPEAGIRLDGATGVKVQNCVIDGFDFGVVIQNEKVTTDDPVALAQQRNKILSNTITSLYQGVTLIDADNNQVSDNVISVSSGGGVHIFVAGDSDSNLITHNTVSGNTNPLNAAPLAPGRPSSPLPVGDRIFFIGDGIYLGNFFSNFTAEDNLV